MIGVSFHEDPVDRTTAGGSSILIRLHYADGTTRDVLVHCGVGGCTRTGGRPIGVADT